MGNMATYPRMMGLSPDELLAPSANDPMQMAPVDPAHAMTAPLGPTHDAMASMMSAATGAVQGAGGAEGEKPTQMAAKPKGSPLQDQEDYAQSKLMEDYHKDADPWGSPDNHPGFLGKLGHFGSVLAALALHANHELTPREAEEQQLSKVIQGIEAENSKEGLERAQTQHENAATDVLQNPPDKYSTLATDQGEMRFDPKTGEVSPLQSGGQTLQSPSKKAAPMLHETDQGLFLVDPDTKQVTPLTYNGQPLMPKGKDVNTKEGLQQQLVKAENSGDTATANKLKQQIKDLDPNAEQRIVIQQQNAANTNNRQTDAATEREFTYYRGKWDKDLTLYNSQNEKLQEAESFIGNGALGDALGSIKALSGLASGAGSGVRITQAELNSIARARGLGGDFQAALQKFGDGKNLTPGQEKQLRTILSDVQGIAGRKERAINQGLDDMSNAKDKATIRRIDSQLRHALMGGQ
jgi:hypothetical protein